MNMKRMRGRNHRPGGGGGGGGGGSPIRHNNGQIPLNRNHVFDSNGPDLRIRGTAQQLFEKYLQLGRDATSSGDRVMAEGYFQHAEHYFRILNAIAQATQQSQATQQIQHNQRGRHQDAENAERGGQDEQGQHHAGNNHGGQAHGGQGQGQGGQGQGNQNPGYATQDGDDEQASGEQALGDERSQPEMSSADH